MPKVKEIRKIESDIKEIPKEKKIESIDDEFEEIEDGPQNVFNPSFSPKRHSKTSTLEADGPRQDTFDDRQTQSRTTPDERDGRSTVNFYAGGSGANPYKNNSYTPVGSSESSSKGRDLGERGLGNERGLDNGFNRGDGGNMERNYAGQSEQDTRNKKRNLM